MSSSKSAGLPVSPAYDAAMEDLTELLQATQGSVERILSTLSSACTNSSGLKAVRTSLSIGFAPHSRGDTSASGAHNPLRSEDADGAGQIYGASSSKAAYHPYDVESWLSQVHLEAADHGKVTSGMNARHQEGTSPEETALKNFLKEIKTTMSDWLARQKMMGVQDKTGSVGSPIRAETRSTSALGLPNGAPLLFGFSKEQSLAMNLKAVARQGGRGLPKHHNQREKEKAGGASTQTNKRRELETSVHLDKAVDVTASQLPQDGNEMTHTNHLEQTLAPNAENPSGIGDTAAQTSSADHVGAEQESSAQGLVVAAEGNAAGAPMPEKEVTPITDSFSTPAKTNPAEVKLPLTKWKPPSGASKNKDRSLSFPRTVEVISSPDWLPEGWVTELKTRGRGNSAGSKDKYYVDPVSNRRFRSRKEVVAYLERSKPNRSGDSPEPSPIKKLLEPEISPSVPKKSHKKVKPKESTAPSSLGLLSPMVPPMASPGAVGSRFMPPFRTGQPPSEWLLYESLASLPFPMFDPFYYSDMGANKSGSSKNATHMPARPWFFSGPDASWSPFMDRAGLGKAGDKGRDYHSYYPMPPYPAEAAAKPSGGVGSKKSSKRKSPD